MRQLHFIIFCSLAILLSSCYKKLYNSCLVEQEKARKIDSLLSQQSTILKDQESQLVSAHKTLSERNVALKAKKESLVAAEKEEIEQVKKAMLEYLTKVYQASSAWAPPCINAAHGMFRDAIAKQQVTVLADPKLHLTTRNADDLLDIFKIFSIGNQNAFINNRNAAPDDWDVIKTTTGDFISDGLKFLASLFGAISSGDEGKYQQAAIAAKDLYLKVANDKKCRKDFHANGWIAPAVHEAASNSLTRLNQYQPDSENAKKIKEILQRNLTAITNLKIYGHYPWLDAEWQLKYATIFHVMILDLSA